jgi:hypothetical protein
MYCASRARPRRDFRPTISSAAFVRGHERGCRAVEHGHQLCTRCERSLPRPLRAAADRHLPARLLREPLKPEHIKPRLLGHWGNVDDLDLRLVHTAVKIVEEHRVVCRAARCHPQGRAILIPEVSTGQHATPPKTTRYRGFADTARSPCRELGYVFILAPPSCRRSRRRPCRPGDNRALAAHR